MIEVCIDIAQHIISDEKYREPLSYRDAFVVLAENKIFNQKDLKNFESMASFRNLLIHYYERVDDTIVSNIFKNNLSDFDLYLKRIIQYLKKFD